MSERFLSRRKLVLTAAALPLVAAAGTTAAIAAQPNMEDALKSLQRARDSLQKANHNKGGHRVKAIEHVNAAIEQVRRGIATAEG